MATDIDNFDLKNKNSEGTNNDGGAYDTGLRREQHPVDNQMNVKNTDSIDEVLKNYKERHIREFCISNFKASST